MSDPVFNGFSREELEFQYNARAQVPDSEQRMERLAELSEDYRRRAARAHLDLPYGNAVRERLDVFGSQSARAPVLVFIHGGYWRSRDKSSYSFLAEPLNAIGATVVVVEYSHCPHVTVDHIVRQMRAALAWTWKSIDDYGGDHHRIHVCGNSAGGHLTAMLAATDWEEVDHALPGDLIKGAMSMSGLFDLTPLLAHSINETLGLDATGAKRNSPTALKPVLAGPFIAAVGGAESTEFKRQSRDLVDAWKSAGADARYVEVAERDHFSILSDLLQPDYLLYRQLKSLMKL